MDAWDAIRARRNVRSYQPETVPNEHLQRIAAAGWLAPSASNRQRRDFIIVTDREQIDALATVYIGAQHLRTAPAAIGCVIPKPPDGPVAVMHAADEATPPEVIAALDQFDLGQAVMAMTIAASALGIGTGHSYVQDQPKARAILSVPDDHIVACLLAVGYPADRPLKPVARPDRRPVAEVVHQGSW